MTQEKCSVGIIGASGYGGGQLVRLLQDHPNLTVTFLGGHRTVGKKFADLYPHIPQVKLSIEPIDLDVIADRCQIVFLSLPNGLAYKIVPDLIARGLTVLDGSADYRFQDLQTYQSWYGGSDRQDHSTLSQAVYGLPEVYRNRIRDAKLIGCPDSSPTASLLALAPLLRPGLIDLDSIIIDSKAGTSVGGRDARLNLLMAEADNSVGAYSIARHRHTPEIEQVCSDIVGKDVILQFTPHRVPMVRGLHATLYGTLRDPGLTREDLITIYNAYYQSAPWVTVLPSGIYPQTKWASGTNRCYLGIEVDSRTQRVILMGAIDNLIKGQAGQAIQCLNLMMGWDETLGLPNLCFYP